jgi:hypothetical protein
MRKGRHDNFECFWKQGRTKEKECNNIIFFSTEVQNGEKDLNPEIPFFSCFQNYSFFASSHRVRVRIY